MAQMLAAGSRPRKQACPAVLQTFPNRREAFAAFLRRATDRKYLTAMTEETVEV